MCSKKSQPQFYFVTINSMWIFLEIDSEALGYEFGDCQHDQC
jgi:hypothetical protein